MPGFFPETGITTHHPPLDARLRRVLVWTISLLTAGFTFLDFWGYSRMEHPSPATWQGLATGHGIAPAQYRIGVYYTANFLAQAAHLQFRYIFALADLLCVGASLAVLFFLLVRMAAFRRAGRHAQWACVLLALLLAQVYLSWSLWFQEPETMPSLAILAASALLSSGLIRIPRPMLALTLLLVAILGSTIRVDSVIAFHAGLFLAALVTTTDAIPLGRAWQAGTSFLALVLAVGVEHWIAHTLFPQAVRDTALIQLPVNFYAPNGLLVLFFSLPAWVLTIWLAAKHWRSLNGWARGLILGSLVHFAMFMTFGMSEEVRIFLPFALTLLPLSATLLFHWFEGQPADA